MQKHSSNSSTKASRKRLSTNSYTKIINKSEIDCRYQEIIGQLRNLLARIHNNSVVFNYGTKVITAKPVDIVRVVSELPQNDLASLTIRNIILNAIVTAENKTAGSGLVCGHYLVNSYPLPTTNKRNTLKNRPESKDIDDCLRYLLGTGILFNLMKKIVHRGGLGSDLKFGYARGKDFIVNVSSATEILGEIHPIFETKVATVVNPIVIAVDGFIESLGEIDHLLQSLAEMEENCVILASGYSPDVVTTLSKNWSTGKLKILPYLVKQWDINATRVLGEKGFSGHSASVICENLDITCVTSDAGDALTSFCIDDFKKHHDVHISGRGILFQNESGNKLHTEIKIPKSMVEISGVIRDRCKIAQKACVAMARSGRSESIFPGVVSYTAQEIGKRAAASCKKMIKNMDSLIIDD